MTEQEAVADEAAALVWLIEHARFQYDTEAQVREGLALVLHGAGAHALTAVRISITEQIDYVVRSVAGHIGIVVKLRGSTPLVARRLERCAATGQLAALVLVTAGAKHRALAGRVFAAPDDPPTSPGAADGAERPVPLFLARIS